jgi:hypothetical protein
MGDASTAFAARDSKQSPNPNMMWIPGSTFGMGSDRHYPEEAPVHRVAASGFWNDRWRIPSIGLPSAVGCRSDTAQTDHSICESPGADKEVNWLPAPTGPFNLTMRIYAPRSEALTGKWKPPPVMRA